MTIYVAEIEGRAVVAFHAETQAEAFHLVREQWFKDDLMVLEFEGKPLWSGSEIFLREAFGDECGKWEVSRTQARLNGDDDVDDDWPAFLVPVTDPTDDVDFDDNDNNRPPHLRRK